jgi:Fe-S cluster biogenesis protein NfuA
VEKVKQAIAGKYKISDDGGDLELATVSKYDVVVILGKEKN